MMRRLLAVTARIALAILLVAWLLPPSMNAAEKPAKMGIQMGPYFETLKSNDFVDAAIARGQRQFNELGCAGCHPRGGTIGGTALDASGNKMDIPIPDLHGAALHYPRRAASGFLATIGTMNDL